jgi:hypothetical protein
MVKPQDVTRTYLFKGFCLVSVVVFAAGMRAASTGMLRVNTDGSKDEPGVSLKIGGDVSIVAAIWTKRARVKILL